MTPESRDEFVKTVLERYEDDLFDRGDWSEARLQRYAKYRQWRGQDTGWPWPGSSNQVIPDMLEAGTRMQDTLHNAVMSARPVVVSRALQPDKKAQERNDLGSKAVGMLDAIVKLGFLDDSLTTKKMTVELIAAWDATFPKKEAA